MDAKSLSDKFDAQTIAVLCMDISFELLNYIHLPNGIITLEQKNELLSISAGLKAIMLELERYAIDGPSGTHNVNVLCVTVLHNEFPSDLVNTTMRQFDFTPLGLKDLSPFNALYFLVILMKEFIKAMELKFHIKCAPSIGMEPYYTKANSLIERLAIVLGVNDFNIPNVLTSYEKDCVIALRLYID